MSVASSAASEMSCVFAGEVMNVELALDKVVREAQQQLTSLQMSLRQLCADQDQQVDDEEDFKLCVQHEDEVCDFVEGLNRLLSELPLIAADIRGTCPAGCKKWYADHKVARKEAAKKKGEEAKEAAKERKLLVKQMSMATIEESKCC